MSDPLIATAQRRLHALPSGVLDGVRAELVLDDGGTDACTVRIHDGQVEVRPGRSSRAATRITAGHDTLVDVVDGRRSGIGAFLDGHLVVVGNLALALELDGLFENPDERADRLTRSGVTQTRRVRTVHLEAGPPDADPVVCLHGLGATNASMLPNLWDLATDHRVLAPDLPGHGASSAPRVRYDAAFFAAWLTEWMDLVGIDSAVLVGNSLGGRISLEFALRHPERVRALALLTPAVTFRRMRQFVPLVRLARPEAASLLLPISQSAVVAGIRFLFAQPERLSPAWYEAAAGEFARLYRDRGHRVAFYSTLRQIYLDDAFGPSGFWTRLADLEPPALFIWGAADRLVPVGFARHVVEAVPRSVSVTFEDCGHVPQFELRERTNETIRTFLHDLPS